MILLNGHYTSNIVELGVVNAQLVSKTSPEIFGNYKLKSVMAAVRAPFLLEDSNFDIFFNTYD